MTTLFNSGSANIYSSELGEFVREDHAHFAQILRDFKDTYSLEYIPLRERKTLEDRAKPWRIIDSPRNGKPPYIVRYLSEEDMREPHKVLAWLFAGDIVRHGQDAVLARIEAEETAKQLMEYKRQQEELEDRIEKIAFFATGGRDKKHTIRLGNGEKVER
jgi:hypothetical protein